MSKPSFVALESYICLELYYMSRRVDLFRLLIPQPLTKRDVTVICPRILQIALAGQSLTFPTEELQSVIVKTHRGHEVELPTKFKVGGDWSFDIADSVFTQVRYNLLTVQYKKVLFDTYLLLGNFANSINTNAEASTLGVATSFLGNLTSLLKTAEVLGKCWIRRIDPVEFSQSQPDQPILWRVTVHYNYIKPLSGVAD